MCHFKLSDPLEIRSGLPKKFQPPVYTVLFENGTAMVQNLFIFIAGSKLYWMAEQNYLGSTVLVKTEGEPQQFYCDSKL